MTTTLNDSKIHAVTSGERPLLGTVVVGIDGDVPRSSTAILLAQMLAEQFSSTLVAVHAIPPDVIPGIDVVLSPELLEAMVAERTDEWRKKLLLGANSDPGAWKVIARLGDPADVLCEVVEEEQADLIVLSSGGRHGIGQVVLGSVSQKVLDRSLVPVLVTGPELADITATWSKILFATDLNYTGIPAAEFAAALAAKTHGELIMLHIPKEKPPAEGQYREWTEDKFRERMRSLLSPEALARCRHREIVAYGQPEAEILAAADQSGCDLIVVGVGRHLLIGDHLPWRTASHLIGNARCAVLHVASDMA